MRTVSLALALAVVGLAQGALAQPGSTGDVALEVGGADVTTGDRASDAPRLDVSQEIPVLVRLRAPPDRAWAVGAVYVDVLASDRGPPVLTRDLLVVADVPAGGSDAFERIADLHALEALGAGVFRLRLRVVDVDGAALHEEAFLVRVVTPDPLLTVSAAAAAAFTAAAAYGLWQLLRDLRELDAARRRHRKDADARISTRRAKVAEVVGTGVDLTGGVEGVVAVLGGFDAKAQRLARRRPVAWTLTGLGVGSVLVSWAQALGLVPFDVADLLLAAAAGGFLLLTAALVVGARARSRATA